MNKKIADEYYYLILWLITSLVYSATIFIYLELPGRELLIDGITFSLTTLLVGISMFFAVRYMDIGIGSVFERFLAHVFVATLGVLAIVFISKAVYNSNLYEWETSWESLVVIKPFFAYIIYLLMILVFYLLKYKEYREERASNERELQNLLTDTELNLLKLQLNPHFLFNSLNSINSLTLTNPERAREMIVKLSEFLRYSLGKHSKDRILLIDEIKNVKLYLEIEEIRFGDRLKVDFNVDELVNNTEVPNMILQPLFENAVKFSMYDTLEESHIIFEAKQKGDVLALSVTNRFDPNAKASAGKGIGLQNVSKRLQLHYGERAKIRKIINGEIFEVLIEIMR